MTIPREMTAGDSVSFDVRLADYPAPDWQLFYTLFNATEVITLTSAADDEGPLPPSTPRTPLP